MLANPDRVNKLNAISVYSFIRSYVFVPLGVIICFEGLWGALNLNIFNSDLVVYQRSPHFSQLRIHSM